MKINERNLNLFATNAPFDKEGYLNKRGELNKAFQRRYFVLKGNLLFYFEKKGDKEPLGLIILEGCTIELAEEYGGDLYCFQIVFCGNRSYILAASSQDEMESWMKLLTCAGYTYKNLIISDLQCRLEEIKNSQNRNANNLIVGGGSVGGTSLPPKSPLKRQNPFNRLAAPPASTIHMPSVHHLQQSQFITNDQQSQQPSHVPLDCQTTCMKGGVGRGKGGSNAMETHYESTFYQDLDGRTALASSSFYCSSDDLGQMETSASAATTTGAFDPELFTRVHEQFRPVIMKDILSYNAKRRVKEQPLIVL